MNEEDPTGRALVSKVILLSTLLGLALVAAAVAASGAQALRIDVSGSHLVGDGGKQVRLIGVNRSGSEYSCSSDDGQGGHGYGFFQGPVSDRAIKAMKKWRINAVALPLNEACWLGGYGGLNPDFVGDAYRRAIEGYVDRLNAHGIYVVLRLSGAGPGDSVYGAAPGDSELPMADADHSLDFWSSVATTFAGYHAVLFHAYDEPHKVSWDCSLNGCPTDADGSEGEPAFGPYQAVGHQAIVDAIRGAGATQPIIVSGIDFAGDVGQWQDFMPNDPLGKLVVGWNSFDYSGNFGSSKPALRSLARSHPIVVGGFGDTDCDSSYSSKLMRFADGQGISYLAWTWNTEADYGGCSNALLGPKLSAYYSAKPSGYGKGVRRHFRAVMGKKHKRASLGASYGGGRADLKVTKGSVHVSKGKLKGSFEIRNAGSAKSKRSIAALVVAVNGKDLKAERYRTRPLAPSASQRVDVNVSIPSGVPSGKWPIEVCADQGGKVNEQSERNNCDQVGKVKSGSHGSGSSFPANPISFDKGQPFQLNSRESDYWIYVPDAYDSSHKTPTKLFVWMHGCGGDSGGDIYNVSPGGSQDWISVSVGGRDGDCWDPDADQAKVLAAISDVKSHFDVDPRQVILGGYSSGGDLAYRTAFYKSRAFAGVLAENTSPFRDTGSSQADSLAAATSKFHVVHLAHLQDDVYPIGGVRAETDAMVAAGFPLDRVEVNGTHYDNPGVVVNGAPVPGTDADVVTYLLPHIDDGWTSGG